jgi:hypothetical protein
VILGTTQSINGVTIRLTDERWEHILDTRPYLRSYEQDVLSAVLKPDMVLRAARGVLVAVVAYGHRGYLHVIYKERSRPDGFIITAYFKGSYNRRQVIFIWRADEE